jgi:tetratricopeptide (TPR) repeat protein
MTAGGRDFGTEGATVTGMLAASELAPGEILGGRYRIERLLGMGGMGLVYRARDLELDIDVALKLLRPELATRGDAFERFRQELLLARQVSSPHVVRIHDLVRHGGSWLISMDFVDGESLEHRLDHQGKLAPDEAVRITRQLAEGLAAAHKRGVVHRDLKPANVMLDAKGEALITDFGVARSAGSTGITGSGVIIGTPEYLSPEQARAETLDGRSDLYALGLILYEMLTGTLPFRGGTPAEMLAQRIVRSPPDADTLVPGLPAFAVRLCARLLSLRPAHRFQRAEDVVRAIDDRRLPRAPVPSRQLWAACAVAVVIGLGTWAWQRGPALSDGAMTAARTAALDVAAVPTLAAEPADADLAAGLDHWLARALTDAPDLASADVDRVARALSMLRYDAAGARRFRPEVAEALRADLLLEPELRREGDAHVLAIVAWRPGDDSAQWTEATPPFADTAVPAALGALRQRLVRRLGIAAPTTAEPTLDALRLRVAPLPQVSDSAALEARLDALRAAGDADAWWDLLDDLDRNARRGDAASAARAAADALAARDDRAAQRARALATLLLGDASAAAAMLAPLVKAASGDLPLRRLHGRALGESGDIDGAREQLSRLVAEDERDGQAWFLLGKFAIMEGNPRIAADDYLVRAQVLGNRLGDTRLLADSTNALGIAFAQLGQPDPAAESYSRAAALREGIGDVRGQGLSLSNLATVRLLQGNFDAAEVALTTARRIIAPLGDPAAEADMLNALGALEEQRGNDQVALDWYRQALTLRQAARNERLVAESMLNVAYSYLQTGDYSNSEIYWAQADRIYAGIDDQTGIARAAQGAALAMMARGSFSDARQALERSLALAQAKQMATEHAAALATRAELNRLEGRVSETLADADEAERLFLEQQFPRGRNEARLTRAQAMCDIGAFADLISQMPQPFEASARDWAG